MANTLERKTLKEWRLARGLTVEELAKKANVSRSTLRTAEHGLKAPRYSTLVGLADALGVKQDQIIWPETFKNPPRNKGQKRGPRMPKEEQ